MSRRYQVALGITGLAAALWMIWAPLIPAAETAWMSKIAADHAFLCLVMLAGSALALADSVVPQQHSLYAVRALAVPHSFACASRILRC